MLSAEMEPGHEERVVGTAEVKQVFEMTSRSDVIAGCIITMGEFTRANKYRLIRDGHTIADVQGLSSLKHFKDDVRIVKKGSECGVMLKGWSEDYQQGDKIEAYEIEAVPRRIKSVIDSRA